MRILAIIVGVLLLLPGACSAVFMAILGPVSVRQTFRVAFRGSGDGGYDALAATIWSVSFALALVGLWLIARGARRR